MSTFICQPGELLYGTRPLLSIEFPDGRQMQSASEVYVAFLNLTGLDTSDVVVSRFTQVPMPYYPSQWPEGRKRWEGINPAVMSNPLFWLPARMAGRYTITDDDGITRLENDDEWAVRIAVEMSYTSRYDSETGQWQDVLMTEAGLDISNEDVLNRVSAWLDGADDEVLDNIDISGWFDAVEIEFDIPEGETLTITDFTTVDEDATDEFGFDEPRRGATDEFGFDDDEEEVGETFKASTDEHGYVLDTHWAVQPVLMSLSNPEDFPGTGWLRAESWSIAATDLAEMAGELVDRIDLDINQLGRSIASISNLSEHYLSESSSFKPYSLQWNRLIEEWSGDETSLRTDVVAPMFKGLSELAELFDREYMALTQTLSEGPSHE